MSHEAFVHFIAYLPVLIVAIIGSTPLMKKLHDKFKDKTWCGWIDAGLVLASMVLCTASLVSSGYNPFIYFRF